MLACHAGGPGSIPGRCKSFGKNWRKLALLHQEAFHSIMTKLLLKSFIYFFPLCFIFWKTRIKRQEFALISYEKLYFDFIYRKTSWWFIILFSDVLYDLPCISQHMINFNFFYNPLGENSIKISGKKLSPSGMSFPSVSFIRGTIQTQKIQKLHIQTAIPKAIQFRKSRKRRNLNINRNRS